MIITQQYHPPYFDTTVEIGSISIMLPLKYTDDDFTRVVLEEVERLMVHALNSDE